MNLSHCHTSSLCGDEVQHPNFMLALVDEDDNQLSVDSSSRTRAASNETVLPSIEEVPYLLDSENLLPDSSNLTQQDDSHDVYHSAAVSLHSYSQTLPNMASVGLHNYSQPVTGMLRANTEILHNYSQPWPQSTDSYTSVHNYCINNDSKESPVDSKQETKIFQINSYSENEEPLCLKIQFTDTYTCRWKDCDQAFDSISSLVEHINCHLVANVPGIYVCQWANCTRNEKPFDGRYRLVQHMRIHTCERPHKCSLCLAEFSSAEGLTKHQRVHTGEKPYPCTVAGCKKAFKNSGDRFKHVRSHQIKYGYACKHPGCPKKYTDPGSLRKHVKRSHPPDNKGTAAVKAPAVRRKIQAAALLSNSGSETALDISALSFVELEPSVCSDSNPLLTASSPHIMVPTIKHDSNQDVPLDLSTSLPTIDDDQQVNIEWIELD